MAESDFPAGEYTLTVDHYEQREYTDDRFKEVRNTKLFTKGEVVELDEAEALRLGHANSIAEHDSLAASVARGEVDPALAPPATASKAQLEAQAEAIQKAIEDRDRKNDEAEDARSKVRNTDNAETAPVPGAQATDADAAEGDEAADEGGGVPKKRGGGRAGKVNA